MDLPLAGWCTSKHRMEISLTGHITETKCLVQSEEAGLMRCKHTRRISRYVVDHGQLRATKADRWTDSRPRRPRPSTNQADFRPFLGISLQIQPRRHRQIAVREEEMRNPEKMCSQLLLIPSGTKLLILHKGPSINEVCKPFLILDPLDLLHFTVKLTLSESTSKGLG